MTQIVFVHGIRSKPAPDVLLESYRVFLSKSCQIGLSLDQLQLAYWADLAGYAPRADDRGGFRPYSFKERLTFGGLGLAKASKLAASGSSSKRRKITGAESEPRKRVILCRACR